jgi:hypothetical protein
MHARDGCVAIWHVDPCQHRMKMSPARNLALEANKQKKRYTLRQAMDSRSGVKLQSQKNKIKKYRTEVERVLTSHRQTLERLSVCVCVSLSLSLSLCLSVSVEDLEELSY